MKVLSSNIHTSRAYIEVIDLGPGLKWPKEVVKKKPDYAPKFRMLRSDIAEKKKRSTAVSDRSAVLYNYVFDALWPSRTYRLLQRF